MVVATLVPLIASLLNTCFDVRIRQDLATPLPRVVRAGRMRVTVRHASGTLLPNAQVVVEGPSRHAPQPGQMPMGR